MPHISIWKTMSGRRLWLMLVALALGTAACSNAAEVNFAHADQPATVVVSIGEGDVTIRPNSSSGTEVRWEASGATPNEPTLSGGILTISDACASDCSVNYTILVGDNADVTVELRDGNVTIAGVDGAMSVAIATGNVSLNAITGSFQVDISSEGDVLGTRLAGTADNFATASGSIDVTYDSPVSELVIHSGRGDVTAQLPGGPYAVSAPDDADVQVDTDQAASANVTISTGDGDATIYKR